MNCEGLHRRFRKRGQRPVSLNSKRKNCAIDPTCIRRHVHSEFAPLVQTLDHLATPTATSTAARLRGAFPKVHSEKRVLIKMLLLGNRSVAFNLPIYLGGNGSGVTVSDLLDLCLGGDLGRGLLGGRGSGVLVWERRLLTLLPFASSLSLGLLFASSFSLCWVQVCSLYNCYLVKPNP